MHSEIFRPFTVMSVDFKGGKTVRENARGEGLSTLSLPQLTCMLSQAQRSFTSLINHINWSNKALAGQKILSAAKKLKCRKNPDMCARKIELCPVSALFLSRSYET